MHEMYLVGVSKNYVGDNSSHLLFNDANVNYHLLHITYTTGVHTMYNIFRAYPIHMTLFIVELRLLTKGWKGSGKYRP